MPHVRSLASASATAVLVFCSSPAAFAQSNDEVFPQLQWNFGTPGARANAMGRAFIGVADDASASITNPAGLSRLTRPQFYVEFKGTDVKVKRLAAVDSFTTLAEQESSQPVNSITFLAASYPVNRKLTVGFTYSEFLRYEERFSLEPRRVPGVNFTFFGVEGDSEFKGTSYAFSAAAEVTPKLHAGITVSSDHLKSRSSATRFATIFGPGGPNDVSRSDTIVNRTGIDSTDHGAGVIAGLLYTVNEMFTVGLTYAKGPAFAVDETLESHTSGTFTTIEGFPKTVSIHVPDRLGFGISARPSERLLVAFDVVRIGYSSLAKDFTIIFNIEELDGSEFSVDDAVEVHAGGEYLLFTGKPRLFVRAGVFTNPNHATRFSSASDVTVNATQNAKFNLQPRKTVVGGTVGAGMTLGSRAQVDLAYVSTGEFVASIGVRF
jgi:long-subunit fatty acid transport protein